MKEVLLRRTRQMTKEDMAAMGQRIKEARIAAEVKQVELAEYFAIGNTMRGNVEHVDIAAYSEKRRIHMNIAEEIKRLRESVGDNRTEFSKHIGIPLRTLEDWESGRRTPPEYIPRLIAYQLKYEELMKK